MIVPTRKGPDAVPACHDSVDSQPKANQIEITRHFRILIPVI
jgi:hypothetical protein